MQRRSGLSKTVRLVQSAQTAALQKPELNEANRQLYSDAYKECVAVIRASTDNYDKTLITIASAFLAVPIALVRQVTTTKPLAGSGTFYLASGFFVLTILCVLMSFQLGNKVQRCRFVDLKEYYLDEIDEALNRKSIWSSVLSGVNFLSGLLFFAGVSFTVLFVYRNLGRF